MQQREATGRRSFVPSSADSGAAGTTPTLKTTGTHEIGSLRLCKFHDLSSPRRDGGHQPSATGLTGEPPKHLRWHGPYEARRPA